MSANPAQLWAKRVVTTVEVKAQTWDNKDGPSRRIAVLQPGPDHLPEQTERGCWQP